MTLAFVFDAPALATLFAVLFQEVEKIEGVLGKTGTAILGLMTLVTSILAVWQFQRSGVLKAAILEKDIHKEASARKSVELEEAHKLNGELQAKTNLQPLMEQSAQLTKLAIEQMELTRKFERDYANTQANVVAVLSKMEDVNDQRYADAVQVIQSCVEGIAELRKNAAQDREQNNEAHRALLQAIRQLSV